MIKFHCINKTKQYYEEANLTIRLKDGAKKDLSYTTDIRINPYIFDFKGQGYSLKATNDNPLRLKVNDKISQVKEIMLEIYKTNKHLNLTNKDFRILFDKVIFEKEESRDKSHSNFADELDKYIEITNTTEERRDGFRSDARSFRRFQYYYSFLNGRTTNFRFCDINWEVLNMYKSYLRNEYLYYQSSPEFYRDLTKRKIAFRTDKTIIGILKKIHAFTNQFRALYRIDFEPFANFIVGTEKYEEPIVLLDEEYEYIQNNLVDDAELRIIQQMFILQSFFGLRYADFHNAKMKDIVDGCLLAYPKKTISSVRKVNVPLNDFCKEIIMDLSAKSSDMTYIVPRFSLDQYNIKLKELFKRLGLNRIISKYDEETKQTIHKPLYEVITSHFARRTFINTLINAGFDSLTIKKLCGMSENSREIARYYQLNKKHSQACANSLDKRKATSTVPTYQIEPFQHVIPNFQRSSVI